jgi:hypothetical protein
MKRQSKIRFSFNPRLILGASLIAASFFSAYLLANSNNRMITVWSAVSDLAPGQIIQSSDITPTQVLIPENAAFYLNADFPLVGSHVVRPVGASELIPSYSLTEQTKFNLKRVPISLARSRVPLGVTRGSVIDIYVTPKEQLGGIGESSKKSKATSLLKGVSVEGIDLEASKLGGDIGLTILVPPLYVQDIVAAMAVSNFVVVRNN